MSTTEFDAFLYRAFEPVRELEPSAALVRGAVTRAERRRWRFGRRGTLAVALAALMVGGGAVAELMNNDRKIDEQVRNQGPLQSSGDPALDRLVAQARTKPELAPIANTISVEARQPDPRGGLDWVLVVWRTQSGGWCSLPARQQGDQIGARRSVAGQLRPFQFAEGGACSSPPLTVDEVRPQLTSYPGGPTILHGVAGRAVAALTISGLPGVDALKPGERGGFMAVVPQEVTPASLTIDIGLKDGSHKSLHLDG
ncbi:MAG: hypothetical protein QOJ29_2838 [Thermoleophilaceae bacterium]|nr:hypothetical protein [Thermoleophilaceae bacterium]